MLDHRLWPRAAALAERFWSPARVRDPLDMYRRLAEIHDQLTVGGLMADAQRRRMAARLAPGNTEPVTTLLDIVTPVRNMAHDHRIVAAARGQRIVQSLNALADAAPADSLLARKFADTARQFIAGDRTLEPTLRAQLNLWRDNDARFAAIARGNAMLEPALPTSANIAALAGGGLDAIDAIVRRADVANASWDALEKRLAEAEAHEAASILPIASFVGKHPPADLIIAITPAIRELVNAARSALALPKPARTIGMVDQPCPAPLEIPAAAREFQAAFLEPGQPNLARLIGLTQRPEFIAYNDSRKAREAQDWAGLCRYQNDNAALLATRRRPDIVFLGDSITENWVLGDPTLFSGTRIGRGIGGQTTAQMVVRFHSDVIALRPRTVHLMAGTNDVAGNAGPTSERAFQQNIQAMVEMARAHGIRVVLASIPPAAKFTWRPELQPARQIAALNAWLRDYAARERLEYLDYYSVLATADGALRPAFGIDGVHPNRDGYAAMRALATAVQ
jgi:lysophospholipase L1-like esterase